MLAALGFAAVVERALLKTIVAVGRMFAPDAMQELIVVIGRFVLV